VDKIVKKAYADGVVLAAICAAPMILGKRGMLSGKRAVCYPGFEKYLEGAVLTGGRVEEDGNVITACGMGAALEFAVVLCKRLKGEDEAERIASSVLAR
jgi:4-methyl-5(b-hydroxyethyl)-thiazole monophosphate biosynthesis